MKRKLPRDIAKDLKRLRALHKKKQEEDIIWWMFFLIWDDILTTDEFLASKLPGLSDRERKDLIARNESRRERLEAYEASLGAKPTWLPGSKKKET